MRCGRDCRDDNPGAKGCTARVISATHNAVAALRTNVILF